MSDDLQKFLRENKNAWQYAFKAWEDYLLARLGLLNGLFSSLEVSTQAIEKLIKSYLCFHEKKYNNDTKELIRDLKKQKDIFWKNNKCNIEIKLINESELANATASKGKIELLYVKNLDQTYKKNKWFLLGVDEHNNEIKDYLHNIEASNRYLNLVYSQITPEQPNYNVNPEDVAKMLKNRKDIEALILLAVKKCSPSQIIASHDLIELYKLASSYGLNLSEESQNDLLFVSLFFGARYHDTKILTSYSTGLLPITDGLVFEIWDNFKCINKDYYYSGGINTPVYSHLMDNLSRDHHYAILARRNSAYLTRKTDIEATIKTMLTKKRGTKASEESI